MYAGEGGGGEMCVSHLLLVTIKKESIKDFHHNSGTMFNQWIGQGKPPWSEALESAQRNLSVIPPSETRLRGWSPQREEEEDHL